MRYSKEHKSHAKATIVREAARTLKENGFEGVGVDGLAASAQVTSGALYSNFANKEAVLEEVVCHPTRHRVRRPRRPGASRATTHARRDPPPLPQ
jgi:DNA-binding transcriptional regulator YbjK